MDQRKFVIITTVNSPTKAVQKIVKEHPDWKPIVVGDRKTPKDWVFENVKYLSPKKQLALDYEITKFLPWNNYCRKMIGYLYAIERGADVIADLDDDNIPYLDWGKVPNKTSGVIDSPPFFNAYSKFTSEFIWPRGYPLNYIKRANLKSKVVKKNLKVGIWQFLVDKDPDVDAIYRFLFDKPIYFEMKKAIKLNRETYCTFNSQNTLFTRDVFPLLYLPAHVNFRFTDILRGIVAQKIMWKYNYTLGFASPSVIQIRNVRNNLNDFESEIPAYLHVEKIVELMKGFNFKSESILENLIQIYELLGENKIIETKEYKLIKAWGNDIKNLQ